jgi:hypothetical protein
MTRDVTDTDLDALSASADGRPNLSSNIRSHLGEHLRTIYERLAPDEQPTRFAELIAQLEAALKARGEAIEPEFRNGLLAAVPSLRAFALSLTSNPARPGSGHPAEGLAAPRPLPAGHEPERLAVHDPAQHLLLGPPQARARGRGPGRLLRRPPRHRSAPG